GLSCPTCINFVHVITKYKVYIFSHNIIQIWRLLVQEFNFSHTIEPHVMHLVNMLFMEQIVEIVVGDTWDVGKSKLI
ncbi:hypothetical protein ACJX0J_031331, partial [Zea mays]